MLEVAPVPIVAVTLIEERLALLGLVAVVLLVVLAKLVAPVGEFAKLAIGAQPKHHELVA